MNTPSVFAVVDGVYYGCQCYPTAHNFPSVDYWQQATGSDSDRFFKIKESKIDEEQLSNLVKFKSCYSANCSMTINSHWLYIKSTYKVRKGKVYQSYLAAKSQQDEAIKAESDYNAPFEKASMAAYKMAKQLLLSL